MVRRVKSACRLCGGEVEQRNMLTKRGYHEECAPLAADAAIRSLASRTGPVAERQLVRQIVQTQLELRRVRASEVDPTEADP